MSDFTGTNGLAAYTLFEDGRWFAFERTVPMWGEGETEDAAMIDLIESLVELRDSLRGRRLAPHLRLDLAYLERALPLTPR